MKSYNQGEMECLLATAAALSDLPLYVVRKIACGIADVDSWKQAIEKGPDFCEQIMIKVARQLNLSPQLFYNPYGVRNDLPTASMDEILMGKGQGRGTIIIQMIGGDNKKLIRHIFPFENGLIYDSAYAELGGVIFSEIIKRYTQWGNKDIKVVAIYNEEDFKVKL